MKNHRSMWMFAVCVSVTVAMNAAAVKPTDAVNREEVRKQLSAFLSSEQSGFGALKKSPATLDAVQKRIAMMSDDELAQFQKLMAETPNWRSMPQTLAASIPPEVMKNIRSAGADYTARLPKAERMRDDVRTLAAVLKVLPEAKLRELGIERKQIDSLDQSLAEMTPLQAAVLQKQLTETTPWDMRSAAAVATLPPELQRGAMALAKHGPLTKGDLDQLEKFRTELTALLDRVVRLPQSARPSIDVEALAMQRDRIAHATPEVAFMIREQLPADKLASLRENVATLERMANLTDRDRKQLESFRGDMIEALAQIQPNVREKLAQLPAEQLVLLQDRFKGMPEWREILPAYYGVASSPEVRARLDAARQTPDPSLEQFRAQAIAFIDAAAAQPGADAALAAHARKAVESAAAPKLEAMRQVTARMPAAASVNARLRVATLLDLDFDCKVHTPSPLPDFSLDFICDPIEDAIEGVFNGLNAAINAVQSTVNSLVNGILNTVNTIWSFVQQIPDLAWNAIKTALNLLLDVNIGGVTLRSLIQDGIQTAVPKLQTALGLAGNWWSAMGSFTLPTIPCPSAGTHTPFGDVGTGEAVTNYGRYKFFIDKIIDMIPDTEVSLAVKIPAQVLYASFDFMGVCLQDAANDANDQLLATRHTTVTTGLTSVSNQVATTGNALSVQMANGFNALSAQGNTQSANMTQLVNLKASEQTSLALRLQIELNLQAGEGKALAMFELPAANNGYLELARDTVAAAMNAMLAAGQSINQAQKYFNDAQTAISQLKYKDAFKSLQMAYREVAR